MEPVGGVYGPLTLLRLLATGGLVLQLQKPSSDCLANHNELK